MFGSHTKHEQTSRWKRVLDKRISVRYGNKEQKSVQIVFTKNYDEIRFDKPAAAIPTSQRVWIAAFVSVKRLLGRNGLVGVFYCFKISPRTEIYALCEMIIHFMKEYLWNCQCLYVAS